MKTATFVKTSEGTPGDARIYKLSKPMGYDQDWKTEEYKKKADYVMVSRSKGGSTTKEHWKGLAMRLLIS